MKNPPLRLLRPDSVAATVLLAAAILLVAPGSRTASGRDPSPMDSETSTMEHPFVNSLDMKFVPVPGTKVLFSIWDTRVQDFQAYARETGYQQSGGIYVPKLADDDKEESKKDKTDKADKDEPDHNEQTGRDEPRGPDSERADTRLKWALDLNASWEQPGFKQTEEDPVVGVTWDEAQAFCAWLTRRDRKAGRIGLEQEYRLPTDAEWSAAAGKSKYPWGNAWPPPEGAGNFADDAFVKDLPGKDWKQIPGNDGYARTSPVETFKANRLGLYDMSGNVWQWCEDRHPNDTEDIKEEMKKERERIEQERTLRGGSWRCQDEWLLLMTCRYNANHNCRDGNLGFRCVLATATISRDASGHSAVDYDDSGNIKIAGHDWEAAIAEFDRALALDAKFARAYHDRGDARKAKGDSQGADDDYKRAAQLDAHYAYPKPAGETPQAH